MFSYFNFVNKYLRNKVDAKDISIFVKKWENSKKKKTLANYLGLSEREVNLYLKDNSTIYSIMKCYRKRHFYKNI